MEITDSGGFYSSELITQLTLGRKQSYNSDCDCDTDF